MPAEALLPDGFRVTVGADIRQRPGTDGGLTLLAGVPARLVHLDAAQARLMPPDGTVVVTGPDTRRLARGLLDAGVAHPAPPSPPLPGTPVSTQVTVVVPVRDRPLEGLLAGLAAGPVLGGLVVVDDGSADPAPLRHAVTAAGGRVVRHPLPRGPSAARNSGLAVVTTPLVAFLDSDVVPEPGWLVPLLRHLTDPAVALVAPRVVALHPGRGGPVGAYEALRSSLDLGTSPGPVHAQAALTYLPAAAMLLRAAAVDGPAFAPELTVAEDVDLLRRLDDGGWVVRFEPAARVAHEHRVAPVPWLRRKTFYGSGAAGLARRHPAAAAGPTLSGWTLAVAVLLVAGRVPATAAAGVVALRTVVLARSLGRLRTPWRAAAALVAFDVVGGSWQLAAAACRVYWPLAVVAAWVSPRTRRALAVAALGEALADRWVHRDREPRARLSAVGYVLLHRLDDLAYGAGLWWGALTGRTAAPLRARLVRAGPLRGTLADEPRRPRPVRVGRGRGAG